MTEVIVNAIIIASIYYVIRGIVLGFRELSIDYLFTKYPPVRVLFLEPFNYREYIFFETKEDYLKYLDFKDRKGPREWWR